MPSGTIDGLLLSAGQNGVALRPASYVNAYVLAAGVAKTVTLPSGVRYALFSATADFYLNTTAAAAVPAADVTDGTASELNPLLRDLQEDTTISIIAPAACIVTVSAFK